MIFGKASLIIIGAVVLTLLLWVVPAIKNRNKKDAPEASLAKKVFTIVIAVGALGAAGAMFMSDYLGDSLGDTKQSSESVLDIR